MGDSGLSGRAVGLRAVLAVPLAVCALAGAAHGDDAGPRDLLKRVLDTAPKTPFVAKLTLSSEGGLTRQLEMQHKRLGDAEATYMEVTAPFDVKDTRFLFFDRVEGKDEQYIYMPAMKRAFQVADEIRKQPFLGSEFYVSDLVSPELDAFAYAFAGDEAVAGRACKLVEVTPKTPGTELYGKVTVAIDPVDLVIVRTAFFDLKGKPLKTWTIERLERRDGVWTPFLQKMTNLQERRTSELVITDIHYGAEVADTVFTRTHLTR